MNEKDELTLLAEHMASRQTYDEAWMTGLELQALGSQDIQAFCYVLEHGTPEARRAAAFWLSDEVEIVPADVFFMMADDSDSEIRFHAAYCLSYVLDQRTVPTLQAMMHKDGCEEVRQTAAQSLYAAAKLNNRLATILTDYEDLLHQEQSPSVREEAVTCLANFLKSPVIHQAILLLEKALKDTNQLVREQARISLSVLRDEAWDDARIPNMP